MPLYQLRCRECGWGAHIVGYVPIGTPVDRPCGNCGGVMVRVASTFGFHHSGLYDDPVYNAAVGHHVKSQRHFEDDLQRASDKNSELTGIDHQYEPVDLSEPAAVGVKDPTPSPYAEPDTRSAPTTDVWQERGA